MSADSQSAPAVPSAMATTSNEKVVSRQDPAPPIAVVPAKTGFEIHRDRHRTRQTAIDHHRESVLAGLAKLNADLDKTPEHNVVKRLGTRKKIKSFEEQLDVIAREQAQLDHQKEELAGQEQLARVEEAARTRQELQEDGRSIADVIRHTLGLAEAQYREWLALKNRERICQDVLRSLAPSRMTDLADFSFSTGISQNFQNVIEQMIGEYRRSLADLQSRGKPLPAEMQERIVREQAGRTV